MAGTHWGRLTVTDQKRHHHSGRLYWFCRCDCGTEKWIDGVEIRKGATKSCGCLRASPKRVWSDAALARIRSEYAGPVAPDRKRLAIELGCPVSCISRVAHQLGLEWPLDKKWPQRQATKDATSFRQRQRGHPAAYGFSYAGHKHSEETRAKLRASSHHLRPVFTEARRVKMAQATQNRLRKGGKWYSGRSTVGRRADLENRFFRSRWEANYARFLNFLLSSGAIKRWAYEPITFWFDKIKRGCRSYTPDFRVDRPDDSSFFVEIKGWMDPKSKTKLARMARYYPHIPITLVGAAEYKQLAKQWGKSLPNWE